MELYWILRLPHLHNLLFYGSFVLIIFGLLIAWITAVTFDDIRCNDDARISVWVSLTLLFIAFLFYFGSCLCPDKTDLAIMMGWDALRSDSVQEVIEILKDKIK